MKHLFESYLDYLSSNPGEFTSIILWFITTTAVYVVLIALRKKMVDGASSGNKLMESAEQVVYILNWIWPPAVNYSVYFQAVLPVWCWYFMSGGIAWALGGRWLFEWALALRAGATKVESKTESKTEMVSEKIEVKQETTQQ